MAVKTVIVDNAPELLERLGGFLEAIDGVELVARFEEAVSVVDFVRDQDVDFVFTDIVMPDISGISLARKLQQLPNPPAVVLMSSIPGFSLEAWKIQAYTFLEKPYTRADVAKVISNFEKE
ncbi:MAG: response regulator [Lachnospiraceae bacterium]